MVCRENNCKKRAYYARKYGDSPKFCSEHGKKRNFINVHIKRCFEEGCNITASYGVRNERKYCAEHGKERNLKPIASKLCIEKGCQRQPTFGPFNGKKRTHCKEHKKKDFIPDYKKCISEGCSKQPSYGKSGERPKYCAEHGKEKDYMNIVTKRCSEDGCYIYPNFGPVNGKATHCATHGKERDYVDVTHTKCKEKECDLISSYGKPDGKAEYCSEHGKKKELVNVVHKRCVSDACSFYKKNHDKFFASKINPENGKMELCYNCWTAMYPEFSKRKVRKEQFILAEVQHQIPELGDYFLTWDCKIPGQSCVAFKPDMAWEINDTLLHIEIDEDGIIHEDDDQRLIEIHSASNKKNHVCIRFNPDESIDGSPPCMKKITLKNGEPVYDKDPDEWDRRMNILIPIVRNAYEDAMANKSVGDKIKVCF